MIEDLMRFNESKKLTKVANVVYAVLVFLLIIVIILTQLFSLSKVSGTSMRDTIQDRDLIINGPTNNLQRGDIVTAVATRNDDVSKINIIKRIVAVPGDRLVFRSNGESRDDHAIVELYIDMGQGFVLSEENYIYEYMIERGFRQAMFADNKYSLYYGEMEDIEASEENVIITIGKDEYFLMGDNRNSSRDSREYGAFKKKDIFGKVVKVLSEDTFAYNFFDFIYSAFWGNVNTEND